MTNLTSLVSHDTVRTHTHCHTVPSTLPALHISVNQSIKQKTSTASYFVSKSDTSHCAQRPPTTNVPQLVRP